MVLRDFWQQKEFQNVKFSNIFCMYIIHVISAQSIIFLTNQRHSFCDYLCVHNDIQISTNANFQNHIFVQVAANALIQKEATSVNANYSEGERNVVP